MPTVPHHHPVEHPIGHAAHGECQGSTGTGVDHQPEPCKHQPDPESQESSGAIHHKRAGEGTRTPNLLFLCGWYRRALAGWHRLASSLVRLRRDTHCLRSSSDRWAGKCGGKCGVSASDHLRVSDVHGSEDSFRVSDLCHA
jgi:hypothetical protein